MTAAANRSPLHPSGRTVAALLAAFLLVIPVGLVETAAQGDSAPTSGASPAGLDDLKAMQEQIRKVSQDAMPCTVAVQLGPALGSGVIVSKDGYVLTAAHVVGRPGRDVKFIFPNGRTAKGKTLGMNRATDAGLAKITDPGPWPYAPMGRSAALKPGQWCVGAGHPGGFDRDRSPVVRLGRVLTSSSSMISTDCALIGGDSGGPLFDLTGKIIGVHSRIAGPLTANMHVPIDSYRESWDRLVKGEVWGAPPGREPFIGVVGDPQADDARITHVHSGTPANRAGIRTGDVITRFGGKQVTSFQSLAKLVRSKNPGDRVAMEVRRDGKTVTLNVVIGLRGG